ncbi:NADPH:quinone oxidoreductase family protein [Algoriphagus hitonicola]|uniref:NADPH2:quinone reductase n=1 Tax=Algoriphagus hitonicola TaxID=435880 RepID=A0A1I2S8Y9_9BACT|nr:NADPH:quinone oxidoreductase family protein [Algoriphagus hitonicola]SFG48149.1 NADPH2:quinone reductase [Algoriphagus hitonicola]
MKAIICEKFGMPESLIFGDLPDPKINSNQVLIEVAACGVNFPDTLIIQGKYQFKPDLPFSPGGEVAGKVIDLGEKVKNYQIGDSVLALCGWGGFAEKVAVDVNRIFALPKGIPAEIAATTLYTYGTSFHALKDRGKLKSGETLLVLGAAGGVGLAAVELGKLMGAKVIAVASSQEKLELCREKGATATINYESEDLKSRIKELTNGNGADVIFDPVGGHYSEPAFRSIAWKGRYLVVGFANGEIPKIPLNLPLLKGASIVGVFWGQFSKLEQEKSTENIFQLMKMIREGKIKQHIGKRYPLDEAPEALRTMMDRKMLGKGVVLVK